MPTPRARIPPTAFRKGYLLPVFGTLSAEEVADLTKKPNRELQPYLEYLNGLAPGAWAYVLPQDGDNQRVVKRRLTMAVKETGRGVRYQRQRTGDDRIIFQVEAPEQRRRGRPATRKT